jgi:hypothetical protein
LWDQELARSYFDYGLEAVSSSSNRPKADCDFLRSRGLHGRGLWRRECPCETPNPALSGEPHGAIPFPVSSGCLASPGHDEFPRDACAGYHRVPALWLGNLVSAAAEAEPGYPGDWRGKPWGALAPPFPADLISSPSTTASQQSTARDVVSVHPGCDAAGGESKEAGGRPGWVAGEREWVDQARGREPGWVGGEPERVDQARGGEPGWVGGEPEWVDQARGVEPGWVAGEPEWVDQARGAKPGWVAGEPEWVDQARGDPAKTHGHSGLGQERIPDLAALCCLNRRSVPCLKSRVISLPPGAS